MKEYYEIGRYTKSYDEIQFVIKALQKYSSGDRYFLHLLYVKKNHIYATDGHRLHFVKLSIEIKDGLYKIARNDRILYLLYAEDQKVKYPDVLKIIPDETKGEIIEFGGNQGDTYISKLLGEIYKKGVAFNYKFLKDLGIAQSWKIHIYGELKPVLFVSSSDYKAVIMPFMKGRTRLS